MNSRLRLTVSGVVAVLAAALVGCRAAQSPAASNRVEAAFSWPLPAGWRKETIPFPLEFVPDLPYSGVEELRFAPGMFKPDQEGYWSYAFVWWLDERPRLGGAELEDALKRYFSGLITAVAQEKKLAIDATRFAASVHDEPATTTKLDHPVRAFAGTADLYDAFATGQPIRLNLEIRVWDCTQTGKRAALVLASPKAPSEPIWNALHERRSEFACHPPQR